MNDYIINRESLKRHCEIMCKKFENSITSNAYSEHRFVLDLLEQTEWIPVSERLSEKSGLYLVSGKKKVWICEMLDLMGLKGWCGEPNKPIVEAWRPLPKPYKAESEAAEI